MRCKYLTLTQRAKRRGRRVRLSSLSLEITKMESKTFGSLLDEIGDDFLTCRLCHQHFIEPRTLPCLHSFCTSCLTELIETSCKPALDNEGENESQLEYKTALFTFNGNKLRQKLAKTKLSDDPTKSTDTGPVLMGPTTSTASLSKTSSPCKVDEIPSYSESRQNAGSNGQALDTEGEVSKSHTTKASTALSLGENESQLEYKTTISSTTATTGLQFGFGAPNLENKATATITEALAAPTKTSPTTVWPFGMGTSKQETKAPEPRCLFGETSKVPTTQTTTKTLTTPSFSFVTYTPTQENKEPATWFSGFSFGSTTKASPPKPPPTSFTYGMAASKLETKAQVTGFKFSSGSTTKAQPPQPTTTKALTTPSFTSAMDVTKQETTAPATGFLLSGTPKSSSSTTTASNTVSFNIPIGTSKQENKTPAVGFAFDSTTKASTIEFSFGTTTTKGRYRPHVTKTARQKKLEQSFDKTVTHDVFQCPICREDTEKPSGGVKTYPINFLLDMAVTKTRENLNCDTCSRSLSQTVIAISKCLQCGDLLCDNCAKYHKLTKFTVNHQVLSLTNLLEGQVADIKMTENAKWPLSCVEHQQPQDTYCTQCTAVICPTCIESNHSNHQHKSLDTAAEYAKSELRSSFDKVNMVLQVCQETANIIDKKEDALEKCVSKVHEEIEQLQLKWQESVALAGKQIKNELDQMQEDYKKFLSRMKRTNELHKDELKKLQDQIDIITTAESRPSEILGVEKRINNLLVKVAQADKSFVENMDSNIKFSSWKIMPYLGSLSTPLTWLSLTQSRYKEGGWDKTENE